MAFDQGVAQIVRETLTYQHGVTEKKMFGGLAFMVHGHMCVGIVGSELMVRVGPEGYEDALAQPHARKMDFTGKAMRGFVYVTQEGFEWDADLKAWIKRALKFVMTLPARA